MEVKAGSPPIIIGGVTWFECHLLNIRKNMIHTDLSKELFLNSTLHDLCSTLCKRGCPPSSEAIEGFKELFSALYDSASGKAVPSYYLASFDPGVGKTEAIVAFVKTWEESGFNPRGGILIAVETLSQVQSYVDRLGLKPSDFACFTSDAGLNRLGLGSAYRNMAKVVITTHSMIKSRVGEQVVRDARGGFTKKVVKFEDADDFHYLFSKRKLVVWDEAFIPAKPISVSIHALAGLVSRFEHLGGGLPDDIADLVAAVSAGAVGAEFHVPPSFVKAKALSGGGTLPDGSPVADDDARTLDAIARASGRTLVLKKYGGTSSLRLVGAASPLPPDFGPVVILDASGRVRGTYKVMERCGVLTRLPVVRNDYRNMHLHFWHTPCVKATLRDPLKAAGLFDAVAEAIQRRSDEEWLVIGPKPQTAGRGLDVMREIGLRLPGGAIAINYVHFGKHTATNDYAHIKNVIILGSHILPDAAYDALVTASNNGDHLALSDAERNEFIEAEATHNVLQAVLRANGRNSAGGIAGGCNVHVALSLNISAGICQEAFPGCEFDMWKRSASLSPEVIRLADVIDDHFTKTGDIKISKKDACKLAGIKISSLPKMLKRDSVRMLLASKRIEREHHNFVRMLPES